MGEDSTKSGAGTILALIGLLGSLSGNYVQCAKNKSDMLIAKQQIDIAQQQATAAQEELTMKEQELNAKQAAQNRATQNCNQLLVERDDALKAVHTYDDQIAAFQLKLQIENQQLAMAETQHDNFAISQHKSMADFQNNAIKELTGYRDEAAARVHDIEQNCK